MGLFSTIHINNEYDYVRCGRRLNSLVSSGVYCGGEIPCIGSMLDIGKGYKCSSCGNYIEKSKDNNLENKV